MYVNLLVEFTVHFTELYCSLYSIISAAMVPCVPQIMKITKKLNRSDMPRILYILFLCTHLTAVWNLPARYMKYSISSIT